MKYFYFVLILSFFSCLSVNAFAKSHVADSIKAIEAQVRVELNQKIDSVKAEQDKMNAISQMEIRRRQIVFNFLMIAFLVILAYLFFFLKRIRKLKKELEESRKTLPSKSS
jgi:hypothetical protein